MPTRTLEQLRQRVAKRASVVIGPQSRHTEDVVHEYINESIEEYHLNLTDCGHPQRVTRSTASTSSSSTVTNGFPAYSYVALPADFMALLGVWLQNSDGSLEPLDAFEEADFGRVGDTGPPLRFRIGEDSNGLKILRLLPNADDTYTIAFTYVPLPTELTDDADSVVFFPGGTEYVVCDAALKVLEDDGVQEGQQFQAITARRDRAWQTVYKYAMRQNRATPTVIDLPARMNSYTRLPDYLRS